MAPPDRDSSDPLFMQLYAELRRLAHQVMDGNQPHQTLQTTALVHEAWLRLGDVPDSRWQSREHFYNVAAKAMRRILVDRARVRSSQRRGGDRQRFPLDTQLEHWDRQHVDVTAVHEALEQLEKIDSELCRLVELRFFAGFAIKDIAPLLGKTRRQLDRDWAFARGWLARAIRSSEKELDTLPP